METESSSVELVKFLSKPPLPDNNCANDSDGRRHRKHSDDDYPLGHSLNRESFYSAVGKAGDDDDSNNDSDLNSDKESFSDKLYLNEMQQMDHSEYSDRRDKKQALYYGVEDRPPWLSAFLFGFQQIMVCLSGLITLPLIMCKLICVHNLSTKINFVGTTLVTSGFSTVLQTLVGVRLPLLQGPSFAFIPPIIALMELPSFRCPNVTTIALEAGRLSNASLANASLALSAEEEDAIWMPRMCLIQGGLITASLVQMLIGATGLIGLITKFIGPLTIAPLMLLLEISVIPILMDYVTQHWISVILITLLILTAVYLNGLEVPLPGFNVKLRRCHVNKFPLFAMFPYMFAISITWILAAILTTTNVFNNTSDLPARTDTHLDSITQAPWIRFPYPGQWGMPKVSVAIFIGMVAGTISSVIESVGDYAACARVCNVPKPPAHAVNRGIFMEGFCCFIGGFLGGSTSVTTYTENVGVIGITKVASRATMVFAGAILIFLGLFTKFGAVLSTIPDPLIGGILFVSMAVVGGVGLSSTQLLDLSITRNISILGIAIMSGILIPMCVEKLPIKTGIDEIDQAISILLKTQMIVGAIVGFILDNTVPGATKSQRGLARNVSSHGPNQDTNSLDISTTTGDEVYSFPRFVQKHLDRCACAKYIPMLPNFMSRRVKPIDSHQNNVTRIKI